jgi:hypothetical protein
MGRAWSANEVQRGRIARKLENGDPDVLPDLRGAALLSALQLIVLFPILFQELQRDYHLFRVPEETTLLAWVGFTFDSVGKLFVSVAEIYGVSLTRIEFDSIWGRHLVLLKRLTIEYLLIQAIVRALSLRAQVREAVAAVRQDIDLSVRLGRRAVPALLGLLHSGCPDLRKQAATALGQLRDPRAIEPLRKLLNDDERSVREAAAQALGELGDPQAVEPLIRVLQKDRSDKIVLFHDRRRAAESLGNLGDPRAIAPLTQALRDGKEDSLRTLQAALARIQALQCNGEVDGQKNGSLATEGRP